MQRFGFTIIKNALSNVVRGSATALVALALPHFLTRALDHDRFAAWALMLQIAAYAGYLEFGIQTAVARYLAQAVERGDDEKRDRLVSTAFAMLVAAGVVAMLLIAIVVWQLPHLIRGVPAPLLAELRCGVLVLVSSAALLLPLSTFTGVLIGLHRNEFPALAIGGSRILGAVAVLVSVRHTHSLIWLAGCIGACNLAGAFLQYAAVRRLLPTLRLRVVHITRNMLNELARYCGGLTIFSFAMLLITGLDVTIVGYFNFSAVGYYAIAATLITFFVGSSNLCLTALITPVAVLQARGEHNRIRDLIIETTRLSTYASLLLTLSMLVYGKYLLSVWVGSSYEIAALPILKILLYAQTIRLLGGAYSIALIATGQQNYGIAGALAEGISNFGFSLIGAIWLGPVGVAWGTLLGAVVGVAWLLFYTMRVAIEIPIHARTFFAESCLRPLLCFAPLELFALLFAQGKITNSVSALFLLACVLALLAALFWGKIMPHRFIR